MKNSKYCVTCKTIKNLLPKPYNRNKSGDYYMCRSCNTARAKKYRETVKGKENTRNSIKRSTEKHSLKRKARNSVYIELRAGRLKKSLNCYHCKETKTVEAHHSNYDIPLDVTWLCRQCHADLHQQLRLSVLQSTL